MRGPLLAALLLAGACAHRPAAPAAPASAHFLKPADYASVRLPPPPAPGSMEEAADFAVLLDWQAKRTPAQCAAAGAHGRAYIGEFPVFAAAFPSPMPPEAKSFFDAVRGDTEAAVVSQKDFYARKRPFHYRRDLEPCIGRIGGLAYPSGHTAISRVYARILSDLDPARRRAYEAAAEEAAMFRVLSGVHHPSDIEAGRKLGDAVYEALKRSPKFSAAFASMLPYFYRQPAAR